MGMVEAFLEVRGHSCLLCVSLPILGCNPMQLSSTDLAVPVVHVLHPTVE